MLHEPDAVCAVEKNVPGGMHLRCQYGQQHWFSAPCADFERHLDLGGEVDVMPLHLQESLRSDGIEESHRRSVVKPRGRLHRRILQLHLDGMPLTGANPCTFRAELETLLHVRCDDMLEITSSDRASRLWNSPIKAF